MFDFTTRVLTKLTQEEAEGVGALLRQQGLDCEPGADHTAIVLDAQERVAATASLFGNVVRMVAVSPEHQEAGLSAVALSSLLETARIRGISHLMVYTKPETAARFSALGFRNIAETDAVALLEIGEPGIGSYRNYLAENRAADEPGGTYGAIVMNCNPFTKGHLHLVRTASASCDRLYVVVVETDLSFFKFADRFEMVRAGIAGVANATLLKSGPYAVSPATFPTYFLKDKSDAAAAKEQTKLDIALFLRLYVPALQLKRRFVGTEPESPTTAFYNEAMWAALPQAGVEVCEIERIATAAGRVISASTVRGKLAGKDIGDLGDYLPETTIAYLRDNLHYEI